MNEQTSLRLGAFLSISRGVDKAVTMALEIGANTFQFFTRNPRGGAARKIGQPEIERWLKLRQQEDIWHICGHLPYTINMASPQERLQEFAEMVIADDLRRMSELEAEYLVVHPGSAADDRTGGVQRIVRLLDGILSDYDGTVQLLLEAMALQTNEIGSIEDLGQIWRELGSPPQVGVCLDSCHLFAAGYDFTRRDEVERLLSDLDRHIGLAQVKLLHLNDSKFPAGSRRDRHANIGEGEIGREGLANLLLHPFIRTLPWHLETPVDKYQDYAKDIATVKEIVGER
ncbi:MAG: deoxyribonuclease IV [Bacillota bacterium]|jgi:deoxyribonuclease-4